MRCRGQAATCGRPDDPLVDEVMTKNRKTICGDLLSSEALDVLNSSKITALIVPDAGMPVGIVHLHDIAVPQRQRPAVEQAAAPEFLPGAGVAGDDAEQDHGGAPRMIRSNCC
jgi:signal-transduction protein with cAMP-binding, CBS, and nucleotidyltransferase domain